MIKRAGVIAQDVAIADTDAAPFSNDDAACLERLDRRRDRLSA